MVFDLNSALKIGFYSSFTLARLAVTPHHFLNQFSVYIWNSSFSSEWRLEMWVCQWKGHGSGFAFSYNFSGKVKGFIVEIFTVKSRDVSFIIMYIEGNSNPGSKTPSIMDSPTLARVERAMQRQEGRNIFCCQVIFFPVKFFKGIYLLIELGQPQMWWDWGKYFIEDNGDVLIVLNYDCYWMSSFGSISIFHGMTRSYSCGRFHSLSGE